MLKQEDESMDMKKLYTKLKDEPSIKDIPAIYVLRVAIAIIQIINSGECFFYSGEDLCS